MKKHLYYMAILAMGLNACGPVYVVHQDPPPQAAPAPPPPQSDPEDVSLQTFYDDLSPYGQWIDDPNYGYVWLPDAGPDFKPYATNGQWVYTDEGWTWDSGYPWGWAAFHYGRWFFQDGYGWMWVPGTEWAPAWVSWRNSDDYYGWAPLEPNVGFSASFGGGYAPPPYYWNFVPHQYIASPQMGNYYVRETNNVTIINRTTVINNYNSGRPNVSYGGGPAVSEVSRYTGSSIRPAVIRNSNRPGERSGNGNLTIYRPRVNAPANEPRNSGRPSIAPGRVQTLGNARPVNRTVYGNNGGSRPGNPAGNNNRENNNPPVFNRPSGNPANTGFPANQPAANPPAGRPGGYQPAGQPANGIPAGRPGGNTPAGAPVTNPPAGQPANGTPAGQPRTRPVFNQPAVNPPASRSGGNQPASQGNPPANNNPRFGRPYTPPAQQQTAPPSRTFGQQPGRPAPVQPAQRPAAAPSRPAPAQAPPPPPPKRDEPKRDGRP